MATGRTVNKCLRIYAGHEGAGYPSLLCGLTRSAGPLLHEFPEIDATGICDSVMGYLPGQPNISPGTINVMMDPTAGAALTSHMYPGAANSFTINIPFILQIAVGIRAAPALGDPVFGGVFPFLGMTEVDDGGLVTATYNMGSSKDNTATDKQFEKCWGQLLHPYGEETGANTATGADNGGATTNGGIMLLNVFNSDAAEATIKIEHSANNSTWADLTGATKTFSGGGAYSYYAIVAKGTTVNQYLRWQSTTDTNTFVLSFIRG